MSFLSRFKDFINRRPQLSLSRNGPPLDPSKSYEFLIVVNFEKENSARLCEASLAHLKLATQVKGMENGRWNIDITFTELAHVNRLASIKNSIEKSAVAYDGKILLFAAEFG